jgi:uncharacterized membrane protein
MGGLEMDKKVTSIVAYAAILAGWLGILPGLGKLGMFVPLIIWIVAYSVGDKNGAKVHLNQALIIIILGLVCGVVCWVLGLIPIIEILARVIGIIVNVITLVFSIWGIYLAVKGKDTKFPIIGDITILK